MSVPFTLSLGGDKTHVFRVHVCVDTHGYVICNIGLMNYMRWIHPRSTTYVLQEVQHMFFSIIQLSISGPHPAIVVETQC